MTWPWVTKPTTTTIAPIGGDVSSSIAKFGAIVDSGVVPFVNDRITSVGFPDGLPTTPGLDSASAFSALFLWVGSWAIGPVAVHGLLAVLGFFLTATVTYMFVRRVTGSTGGGLVAGVAYGFSAHLYLVAWAATTYAHMWLFVLPLWAFWNLGRAPSRRAALIAGVSVVPAIFWTPYYALHVFAVASACLLVLAALGPRIGLRRKLLAFALAPWGAAAAVYVGIGLLSSFADSPDRPLSDFYQQASHPLMFVWPGYSSIWGDGVTSALVDRVPRAQGANLYLGASVLALAAIGCWVHLRPWAAARFREPPSPQALAALLGIATMLVCLICSLPPRVLHGAIPTPAALIHQLAPGLRAGQRFVMPMMAGSALLAGLGASAVLRRVPGGAVAPVALAMAVIVGLDLYTRPPGMIDKVPPSTPALEALARAPRGAVIYIQPAGWFGGRVQRACLMQEVFHKPLVNTCGIATPPPRLLRLGDQPICKTLATLRRSGLRYVLTEPVPPPDNLVACFRAHSPVGPWRVLAKDRHVWVFELVPRRS